MLRPLDIKEPCPACGATSYTLHWIPATAAEATATGERGRIDLLCDACRHQWPQPPCCWRCGVAESRHCPDEGRCRGSDPELCHGHGPDWRMRLPVHRAQVGQCDTRRLQHPGGARD